MLLENEGGAAPVADGAEPPKETQGDDAATAADKEPEAKGTPEPNATEKAKSFTQEMLDGIVRSRLERDRKATFKRYGVEDRDGLDALIGKSQSYDVMKERYEKIKVENSSLLEKMAFMSNNINPAREDDVRAYFKGKGIEFNETNLINELVTHPEWLNVKEVNEAPQTTIKALGVEHTPINRHESEEERQKRIFGV